MADFENVHQKVHQNVHRRRGRQRNYLINRDGYWIYQKRIPSGLKSRPQQLFRMGLGRISEPEAIFLANLIKSGVDHLKSEHRLASIDGVGVDRGIAQMVTQRMLTDSGPVAVRFDSFAHYIDLALIDQQRRQTLEPGEAPSPAPFDADLRRFKQIAIELLTRSAELSKLPAHSPVNAISRKYLATLVETFDADHDIRQQALARADENFQQSWDRLKTGDFSTPAPASDGKSYPAVSDIAARGSENAQDENREREAIQKPTPALEIQKSRQPAGDAADILFSEAVEAYVSQRQLNNPHFQTSTVMYPARIWLELFGDRPMSKFSVRDLQTFVNFASKIPPNATKLAQFKDWTFQQIAEANTDLRFGVPALKTVREGQVGNLKALFTHHFTMHGGASPLAGARLYFPKSLTQPSAHKRSSPTVFLAAVMRGALSENSVDFWMPALLYATGRRIGLLTYLQPCSFSQRENGVHEITIGATATTKSGLVAVPYKSSESLNAFVVPRYLVDAGFVDWAKSRKSDFVFACAHRAADPADCSSKRVNRLLAASAVTVNAGRALALSAGTAHGFRGALLDRLSAQGLDPAVGEMQVGHKLPGVQGSYRKMTDAQAMQIFAAHPDLEFPEFDLGLAERLDRD